MDTDNIYKLVLKIMQAYYHASEKEIKKEEHKKI
jgi:hypothetical protein